jgi:hypothetical protein
LTVYCASRIHSCRAGEQPAQVEKNKDARQNAMGRREAPARFTEGMMARLLTMALLLLATPALAESHNGPNRLLKDIVEIKYVTIIGSEESCKLDDENLKTSLQFVPQPWVHPIENHARDAIGGRSPRVSLMTTIELGCFLSLEAHSGVALDLRAQNAGPETFNAAPAPFAESPEKGQACSVLWHSLLATPQLIRLE